MRGSNDVVLIVPEAPKVLFRSVQGVLNVQNRTPAPTAPPAPSEPQKTPAPPKMRGRFIVATTSEVELNLEPHVARADLRRRLQPVIRLDRGGVRVVDGVGAVVAGDRVGVEDVVEIDA